MSELPSDAELDVLRKIDTPTIANAIEAFNVRSNTEGFMGWDIRCVFPEFGVMVGYAVTATLDTVTHGRVHDREARFRFFEAIQNSPKPAVLVLKDVGPRPHHGCHFGDGLATVSKRLGAITTSLLTTRFSKAFRPSGCWMFNDRLRWPLCQSWKVGSTLSGSPSTGSNFTTSAPISPRSIQA